MKIREVNINNLDDTNILGCYAIIMDTFDDLDEIYAYIVDTCHSVGFEGYPHISDYPDYLSGELDGEEFSEIYFFRAQDHDSDKCILVAISEPNADKGEADCEGLIHQDFNFNTIQSTYEMYLLDQICRIQKDRQQETESLIKECKDILEKVTYLIQVNSSSHTQYYVGYKTAIQDILNKLKTISCRK